MEWNDGHAQNALNLIEKALKGIPKAAKLLRYRLVALRWGIHFETRLAGLDDDLHLILKNFPIILRIFDFPIPVRLQFTQGTYSSSIVDALKRSPRLHINPKSDLVIQLTETKNLLKKGCRCEKRVKPDSFTNYMQEA